LIGHAYNYLDEEDEAEDEFAGNVEGDDQVVLAVSQHQQLLGATDGDQQQTD
jgi:hypothetical protein